MVEHREDIMRSGFETLPRLRGAMLFAAAMLASSVSLAFTDSKSS
jgi:hypothetical protein